MCIITDITEYIVVDEALTDSEMLHEYLCEHSVDDYTVTFTELTLSAEYKRMRKDYDYEIAHYVRKYEDFKRLAERTTESLREEISQMRREYEDYKSKTAKVQEFLNNEIAELKTQRDELINNVQELINNVDMTHTKDHFYCESCNGTGARASGEICEDCGGYGTTFKWWADDAPGN
jgi:predicted RNase H-like nuclease (RuvC/YqgF family)